MLSFHRFLVLTLLELQLTKLLLRNSELMAEFPNLLIVITVLVELDQCLLLLLLHLE